VSASQGFVGWLKPHRKKTLDHKKKFKTRLMVKNKKKQALNHGDQF
jgi:hypothetical protein